MRKTTTITISIMLVLTLMVSFTSCGDEDGNLPERNKEDLPGNKEDETGVNPALSTKLQAIDLGTSVKWSNHNLGANDCYERGDYYAWGETKSKTAFSMDNYAYEYTYRTCSEHTLPTLHCTTRFYYIAGNTSADPVAKQTNEDWRMPSVDEWLEVLDKCDIEWYRKGNTTFKGVAGAKIMNRSDHSKYIFLPTTGWMDETCSIGKPSSAESVCYYWLGSIEKTDRDDDRCTFAKTTYIDEYQGKCRAELFAMWRYCGCPIRPILWDNKEVIIN